MARRHVIQARITAEELAEVDRKAQAAGVTRSEYTRRVLTGWRAGGATIKTEPTPAGKAEAVGIAVVITPPAPKPRKLQAVPPPIG